MIKSRNQSTLDFYNSLQEEYVVAEIRKKIYPSIKDKKYYQRVMNSKADKIENIAGRNELPTIFTSKKVSDKVYKKIVGLGIPKFIYIDDNQRNELRKWDYINYFSIDADVIVNGELGKITNNDALEYVMIHGNGIINDATMGVKVNGELTLLKDIRRIL